MPDVILDCSVAVSWLIDDEQDSHSSALLDIVAGNGALVPAHWTLEVGNALLCAMRRKRLSPGQRERGIHLLGKLPITKDTETSTHAWDTTMSLADKHQLTLYDAAYLELVIRADMPLATFDTALRHAAIKEQQQVL